MKRVMFVDDESRVLDGLRRMLRPYHRIWQMDFVGSGESALDALDSSGYDVVVSDMHMPGMDGATLLKEVQSRSPGTVRIVLSGHADLEAAMRSVCISHQFLSKPCDADDLRTVIDRACDLEVLLRDATLQEALGDVGDLPVLPKTYRALVEALAEPEVDLQDVGKIVEQDQGIAAKILQLVNSSYFGIRREITSVGQATTYLGVSTIRDLVLSAEVFRQFEESRRVQGFSLEAEQEHSLLTSRIAGRLFEERPLKDQAFLAGMLHDVGKLVLATQLQDRLTSTLAARQGSTEPFHETEERLHGVSHAEVGAYLLGLWGMPYPIVEAVAHHHHPSRVSEQSEFGVLAATHVAQVLAHEAAEGPSPAWTIDEELLERLGVADRLPAWREVAEREAEA